MTPYLKPDRPAYPLDRRAEAPALTRAEALRRLLAKADEPTWAERAKAWWRRATAIRQEPA